MTHQLDKQSTKNRMQNDVRFIRLQLGSSQKQGIKAPKKLPADQIINALIGR